MEKDIEKKIGAYLTILNEENILYKKENAIKGILEITTNLINRVKELEEENKRWEELAEESEYDYAVNLIPKSRIKEMIEELEKEQEQNRKELARGLDYLSNKMIDSASNKIVINMSIREYLQDLLN